MADTPISDPTSRAHALARSQLQRPRTYRIVRVLAVVALHAWLRLQVTGLQNIPAEGAVIVAPNHKSLLDAFVIGIVTRRHVRYMAKVELFRGPLGWLFVRLGAFPVRRGESDAEALQTARTILSGGGLVVMFPEGTRVEEPDALGSPHHGAGRLALETAAPIVPAAITGTSRLRRAPLPKLRRVQLTFLPAIEPDPSAGPDAATVLIDDRVWPAVREEYGRLRAHRGLIAAAVTALGIGGGVLARRGLDRSRPPRLLGIVEPRKVRRRSARRRWRTRVASLAGRARRRLPGAGR